ncbi:MAG TPA: PAS domain S-box protein [Candidatus Melainabacteria bacterium]|nr:PAS domain S-box protein [Candidatus Melainabacteria bacterium]HIN64920.1 PAS domain S-box protein [Candidatus Obscuribacterales bacterium]
MKTLPLQWRGAMLIAFPMVCQGFFIFAVIFMLINAQHSLERALQMRETYLRLNKVASSINESLVFHEFDFQNINRPNTQQTKQVTELNGLLKTLAPEDTQKLNARLKEMLSILQSSADTLNTGKTNPDKLRISTFHRVLHCIPPFILEMQTVIAKSNELRISEFSKFAKAQGEILRFIWLAICASLLVAAVMFAFFTWSIKKPLEHIAENSKRLSKRITLLPPLKGNDELSRLDRRLHSTYEAVKVASEREMALIHNVSDLVCSLSEDGIFLEANAAAEGMLGVSAKDLLGKSVGDIAVASEFLITDEYLRKTRSSEEVTNFELRLRAATGQEVETHWSAVWSPLRSRVFCVVRDISAEKALSRLKQDFIDMVSHDLRSPLTNLGITLEMIEKGSLGDVNNLDALKEIKATSRNVQILINFINDLLDFQKLDEGRVQLDKTYCSSNEIVKEAISLVKEVAATKNLSIDYTPTNFEIFCDHGKVTQTILNLLSNAIKFSPDNGTISISISEADNTDSISQISFTITDRGPGIPEEYRQRIFEPYQQAPSSKSQGTGLGLAICKMIVEAHGGRIGVTENQSGKGSNFWFTLPTANLPQTTQLADHSDQSLFHD